MKIWIYVDELYPYFGLGEEPREGAPYPRPEILKPIEVTEEEGKYINDTMEEFDRCQALIKSKYG